MENEELILETIEQSQKLIDTYSEQWEEYQKAISAIKEAVKFNPYMHNLKSPIELENLALETRDKTNIYIVNILQDIEKLVRYGKTTEEIKGLLNG